MIKLRLIALASVLAVFLFSSCDKDNLYAHYPRYVSNQVTLTGAKQVPANPSLATATLTGTYDRRTKTYSYKLSWMGLSSNVTSIHIHGTAGSGIVALPSSSFPTGIVQTMSGNSTAKDGTYSGSLFVDEVVVKESDLLSGRFYIDIHTAGSTGGEIRGQLIFPAQ